MKEKGKQDLDEGFCYLILKTKLQSLNTQESVVFYLETIELLIVSKYIMTLAKFLWYSQRMWADYFKTTYFKLPQKTERS